MSKATIPTPGYQRYQPNDEGIAVEFALSAQERMLSEVMTGFGAVPKRGAEVGGVFLGRFEAGTVWIDDVISAPCEHRRGPSFLLSEGDREQMDELFRRHANSEGRQPVGMFRSNTRDHDSVTDEDRELFGKYFKAPDGLFLMVRPYATKPAAGSFFTYSGALLPDSTDRVVTFRRVDENGAPVRRRSLDEISRRSDSGARGAPATDVYAIRLRGDESAEPAPPGPVAVAAPDVPGDYDYDAGVAVRGRRRRGWLWIPLSFIFLLLGILLGFQSALTFYPKPHSADATQLSLGLSALRRGDNLHIRWNRDALAMRSAQHGKLDIEDGQYRKSVDLDPWALQNGSVIYPPTSDNVNLRLGITVAGGTEVIESVAWSRKQQ